MKKPRPVHGAGTSGKSARKTASIPIGTRSRRISSPTKMRNSGKIQASIAFVTQKGYFSDPGVSARATGRGLILGAVGQEGSHRPAAQVPRPADAKAW